MKVRFRCLSVGQLLQEIDDLHGVGGSELIQVGATAVPSFGILEVDDVMALIYHTRRHLAGMAGMHAIILGISPEKNLRIIHIG